MVGIGAGLAIAGAASAAGGMISASGAKSAASQQADAANRAADLTHQQYLLTRQDMTPYMQFGQQNLDAYGKLPGQADTALSSALDEAHANIPGQMSEAWLEQQPGYQFAKDQGAKAVQASAAARGLGVSSTEMKQEGDFVTGLASQYYNTAFNQAQTRYQDYSSQFSNTYNKFNQLNSMYSGQATLGANAAAGLGTIGTNAANTVSGDINQAGQALAAGTRTAATDIGNTLNNVGQLPLASNILNKMYPAAPGTTNTTGTPFFTGLGNLANGYAYNGMATGSGLNALSQQAAGNVAGGAAGL